VTSGTYTMEFEQAIVATAATYLEPFGLAITRIEDFLVSMDDADRQRLLDLKDRMAKMRLAGDPRYMATAQTEAMFGAAEGMKQGGDGVGMAGLFVGAGLGQAISGNMQAGQVQAQAQAAAQAEQQAASAATAAAAAPAAGAVVAGPAAGAAAPATIACPSCGTENAAGAKFCQSCGTALGAKVCAKCGAGVPAGAKFCPACGTPQE